MSEEHDYKEYKIQITEYAGGWQAAIYPTKKGLPVIDWESKTIWSPNVMGALTLAKRHIDSTLSGSWLTPSITGTGDGDPGRSGRAAAAQPQRSLD
jgi:hypothetical protein